MERRWAVPFWVQIAVILLLGVISSVVVRNALHRDKAAQPIVMHSVTFAEQDGTVLAVKEAAHGNGVFPPEYPCKGVFRGWSGGINQVTCDVEVHPVIHQIAEENLFYFHSVYVQEGNEFTLDLFLGGQVSLSRGQLILKYDPDVMKFIGASADDVCQVSEISLDELIVVINSESNINEEKLLAKLTFEALEKDVYATEIQLSATKVELVTDGQVMPANAATINNKIFYLQEVG